MWKMRTNVKAALNGGNKGGLGVVVDEWSTLSRLVGLRGFKRERVQLT